MKEAQKLWCIANVDFLQSVDRMRLDIAVKKKADLFIIDNVMKQKSNWKGTRLPQQKRCMICANKSN